MKKIKLLMLLTVFSVTAFAQVYTDPTNGNVGLGTSAPVEKLDVNGSVVWNGYNSGNPRGAKIGFSGGNYGGIGYNIDYTTSTGIFNRPLYDASSYLEFTNGGFRFYGAHYGVNSNGVNLNGGGSNLSLFATITDTGYFGIGTTNPTDMLTVAGKIGAREIKVSTSAGADFVFEPGYKLPELSELEKFLKTNRHLPEIPTAKQMVENGVNLGELNIKLLQKVEELTLYLIERDKALNQEKAINKLQEERISKLEAFIKK